MNATPIKKIILFTFVTIMYCIFNTTSSGLERSPLPYPNPTMQQFFPRQFSINEKTTIYFDHSSTFNAQLLNKEFQAIGINIAIIEGLKDHYSSRSIILCSKENAKLEGETIEAIDAEDAYYLSVSDEQILITGADAGGQLYGLLTLLQLVDPRTATVQTLEIIDWPKMTFRGLRGHFPKNNFQEIEQFKRIVRAMAFCRLNQLWIRDLYERRFPASIRWESHPEISDNDSISKCLAKELIDYAGRYNVKVMGSLAATADIVWSIYPHLIEMGPGESPDKVKIRKEKNPTSRYRFGSRFNLCPSQEGTYRLLFDLIDEMAPLFSSSVFDIGIDEVGQPYNGSRWVADSYCKGKNPVLLFANYVNRLADYVSIKGKIPIVNSTPFIKEHGGSYYDIHKSVALIRRNIIVNNWSDGAVRRRSWFKRITKFKSTDYFKKYGINRIIHMVGYSRRWKDRPELLETKGQLDCYGAVITHYRYMTGESGLNVKTIDDMAFSSNHFWTPNRPEMNSKPDEDAIEYSRKIILALLSGKSFTNAIAEARNGGNSLVHFRK